MGKGSWTNLIPNHVDVLVTQHRVVNVGESQWKGHELLAIHVWQVDGKVTPGAQSIVKRSFQSWNEAWENLVRDGD